MEEHCREGDPWGAPIVSGTGAGMDSRLILAGIIGHMLIHMHMLHACVSCVMYIC